MVAIIIKMLVLNRLGHLDQLFSRLAGRIIGIIGRILTYWLISPDFWVRTYIGSIIIWQKLVRLRTITVRYVLCTKTPSPPTLPC
jgi:hypothetical protein